MKVNNILEQVLLRIGVADRYDTQALPESDELISLLIKCLNTVISEIASDYIELRMVEEVKADKRQIPYTIFKERLINVRKVSDGYGVVRYRMYPNYISVDRGDIVTVEYSYLPASVSVGGEIMLMPRVTELLLVNGVLGEYCLISGRYEDSMYYDRRYREMLKLAGTPTREIRVKGRG